MEEALWKSADKLRGSVESAEYKHVVLSLFFLKFASDKFEECRNKIIATHGEKYADMKPFLYPCSSFPGGLRSQRTDRKPQAFPRAAC